MKAPSKKDLETITVMYYGLPVPMRRQEKPFWDKFTTAEKNKHVKSIRERIKSGEYKIVTNKKTKKKMLFQGNNAKTKNDDKKRSLFNKANIQPRTDNVNEKK